MKNHKIYLLTAKWYNEAYSTSPINVGVEILYILDIFLFKYIYTGILRKQNKIRYGNHFRTWSWTTVSRRPCAQ